MRKLILPLALAAIVWTPMTAQAQATAGIKTAHAGRQLTLDEAVERALRLHPEIRVAQQELAAQSGVVTQAGVLPNPELEFLREGKDAPNRTSTLQLSIPFELGGKRSARVRAAQQEQRIASLDLSAARARIRAETVAAFYELLAANERSRLASELASIAERATGAASRRVAAGKISPVEEARAKVAAAGVRIEALQAGREVERARIRLGALVGIDSHQVLVIDTGAVELPAIAPLPELLVQLERSPTLMRARAQVDHRLAAADVERAQRIPDVSVILGTKREDDRRQGVIGLSVPLPLFNRNQGSLLESLRRTDKARDELDAETLRLRSELSDAHARLATAIEEAALIRADILPGAESTYQAASRGFELGKFSFLEVLDAQRTLFQSKTQYLMAVVESYRASAEVARIVGTNAWRDGNTQAQEQK